MIKETILYSAIKKVIVEIGKMLIPGGGFIVIAGKVIRLLQFIVEARNKILDLIESFVDSVELAVKGNIPGIVEKITSALTKFITIAIDFLVTFFGLGSLKEKAQRLIARMRQPIIRGIDWVLNKFKPLVFKVFGQTDKKQVREEAEDRKLKDREGITEETKKKKARRLRRKKTIDETGDKDMKQAAKKPGLRKRLQRLKEKIVLWWRMRRGFKMKNGETHTLFFAGKAANAKLMIKSKKQTYEAFVNNFDAETPEQEAAKKVAQKIAQKVDEKIKKKKRTKMDAEGTKDELSGFTHLVDELADVTAILSVGNIPASSKPTFGSLSSKGFGSGMTIERLTRLGPPGSRPSVTNKTFQHLNLRRTERGYNYYALGHLLSEELHGRGSTWKNITPLSRTGNATHETSVEGKIKEKKDAGKIVFYAVTARYPSSPSSKNQKLLNDLPVFASITPGSIPDKKRKIIEAEQYIPTKLDPQKPEQTKPLFSNETVWNKIEDNSLADYEVDKKVQKQLYRLNINGKKGGTRAGLQTIPYIGPENVERIIEGGEYLELSDLKRITGVGDVIIGNLEEETNPDGEQLVFTFGQTVWR